MNNYLNIQELLSNDAVLKLKKKDLITVLVRTNAIYKVFFTLF